MAGELHRPGLQYTVKAASAINPRKPVSFVGTSELLAVPVGSGLTGVRINGFTGGATVGASGAEAVTIYEEGNIVKVRAAASLGVAAEVGVASTNGDLGPVAQASGTLKYTAGVALTPAAAGEFFSLYVKPRTLGGNA